jgi:hypothetical protein
VSNFGRVTEVIFKDKSFSMADFNMEGTIPFDNDVLPNEAEIRIWNLSDDSINRIKRGDVALVNAGYKGDVGTILYGFISKIQTRWDGMDRVTTINIMDSDDITSRKVTDIAYTPGTLASYILRDMAGQLGLPVGQMHLNQDYRYEEGYTASDEVSKVIQDVAADCGTSAYVNKGKLYIRNLRIGADDVFSLSATTGLIGSPEPWEDESFSGFNLISQLQYRITTASVIDLSCRQFTGRLHVRSGTHKFSRTGDFTTEMEAILP